MVNGQRTDLLKKHFDTYRKSLNDLMDLIEIDILEQIVARFIQVMEVVLPLHLIFR